jgi:hypothetical protein
MAASAKPDLRKEASVTPTFPAPGIRLRQIDDDDTTGRGWLAA